MKAMIFAAGLGTRLRPLTLDRPKALVCVAGKTMLQRVIERVRDAGFDDITVMGSSLSMRMIVVNCVSRFARASATDGSR